MSSHTNPGQTVRLAPLIKTNVQQARELEMHMLKEIIPAEETIGETSNGATASSPHLVRRTSGSASPSVGARPALHPESNSAVHVYMFPTSVASVPEEQPSNLSNQSTNSPSPPTLGPAPILDGPARSEALLMSPGELSHTSSSSSVPGIASNPWNPRITSSAPLLTHEQSAPTVNPETSTLSKRRFPFTQKQQPTKQAKPVVRHKRSWTDYFPCSSRSRESRRRRIAARHNGSRHSCCEDLITFHPFRLSFRLSLVLLCIFQVVVSAGCVWIITFVSTQTLITSLSSQLRQTALKEIAGEIHDAMTKPMAAVNQLSWSYSRFKPALDTLETFQGTTGLYADLSMTALNYPAVSGLGCITARGLFFSSINISAYLGAGASPETTNGVRDRYGYAIQDRNDYPTAFYYLPPELSSSVNPNMPVPDFNESSTISEVRTSSPWYTVPNFNPRQRPQWQSAVDAKGEFAWSAFYALARVPDAAAGIGQQFVIAATKAMMKPDGEVAFTCFCTVFLNRLGDLLRSLEVAYGRNGYAMIVDPYGRLVASSDIGITNLANEQPLNTSIWDIPDDRLAVISEVLQENNLFYPNGTKLQLAPTGGFVSGGIFYQNDPAFDAVPINLDGGSYHVQATVLNSTGLLWTIVVVTRDKDFDGDFGYHQLVVGMLTLTVLVIAILVMIFVTHCLNRPLSLVVKYMNAVARMNQGKFQPQSDDSEEQTLSRSAEQLHALKDIYARWRQAVGFDFEDSETEISRTSASKSSRNMFENNSRADNEESQVVERRSNRCDVSRMVDRSAVCLMREVEDMQFTFQTMLHQLTKSTQAVEDANSAKKAFTRYIFHEVRVPLNCVVLGLADLRGSCGQTGDPNIAWTDEQRDVLDIVHEQSQVVGRILNDVLSLHRIEDGALTLQYACFSIESMVLSTMQSFQPGIAEKQIHYTCQLQTVQSFVFSDIDVADLASMPQIDVIGDAHRLRQVLANYLSNAIKFTSPQGHVHVSLQILPATSSPTITRNQANIPFDGVMVASSDEKALQWPSNAPQEAVFRISVRDTGVGVNETDQQKLFSPYMQVLPALLQSGGGSGLGLSIAKSLIRLHGGTIGYQTPTGEWAEEGFKSEFYFEVPLKMCFRSNCANGTPQSIVHKLDLNHQNGEGTTADLDAAGAVGTFNEERQEEDQYLKEIAALQRNSVAIRQSRELANTNGGEDVVSDHSDESIKPNLPALFSSRPNHNASPDSSMRVLAAQQRHQILSQNSSSRLPLSPSVQQSQRRLMTLAQLPGNRPVSDNSDQTSLDSDRSANSSKSGSTGLPDRTLPVGSSPLAKWSPAASQSSQLDQQSTDDSEDADRHSVHLRGGVTPSRNSSLNGTPSSRSDIFVTLNNSSKTGTPLSTLPPKRELGVHLSNNQHTMASPLVQHLSSRAVVSDQAQLSPPKTTEVLSSTLPDSFRPNSAPEVILPVPSPTPAPALERAQTLSASRVLPINSGTSAPLRVLVAEDSVPNLKLLLLLLRKLNCVADGVENGQLCVDRFIDWYEQCKMMPPGSSRPPMPYDVILIDGNMPVLDGPDATRQLRKMGVTIPIIAVTGNALVEDQRAFIDAGANEVLSKPIQQRELQRLLNAEKRKIAVASTSTQ